MVRVCPVEGLDDANARQFGGEGGREVGYGAGVELGSGQASGADGGDDLGWVGCLKDAYLLNCRWEVRGDGGDLLGSDSAGAGGEDEADSWSDIGGFRGEIVVSDADAEIEGEPEAGADGVTAGSAAGLAMMLLQSGAPADQELAGLAASISIPRIRAEVAAGQVGATIRALSNANLVRQAAGLTTSQTAEQSYAEAAAAFALLESGLAAYGS